MNRAEDIRASARGLWKDISPGKGCPEPRGNQPGLAAQCGKETAGVALPSVGHKTLPSQTHRRAD